MIMARVRNVPSHELPSDLAAIYERFAGAYGPFRNQAAVFAHVPAALRHLMSMLLELREAATLPKRIVELAIVTVSKLNECTYCVAHHTPFLVVEGVSPAGWVAARVAERAPPATTERTLADLFAGRLGRVASGGREVLSEQTGRRLADHLEAARRADAGP